MDSSGEARGHAFEPRQLECYVFGAAACQSLFGGLETLLWNRLLARNTRLLNLLEKDVFAVVKFDYYQAYHKLYQATPHTQDFDNDIQFQVLAEVPVDNSPARRAGL